MNITIKTSENIGNNHDLEIQVDVKDGWCGVYECCSLDQIEDLEMNLTDIIKQLQDYRLNQICGGE